MCLEKSAPQSLLSICPLGGISWLSRASLRRAQWGCWCPHSPEDSFLARSMERESSRDRWGTHWSQALGSAWLPLGWRASTIYLHSSCCLWNHSACSLSSRRWHFYLTEMRTGLSIRSSGQSRDSGLGLGGFVFCFGHGTLNTLFSGSFCERLH